MTIRSLVLFALLALLACGKTAHAAQSYDNCTGFIDSLPATIATPGVWCLRHDLATAISSGSAITVGTNNVAIDCNEFKMGGLAAGNASLAFGVYAQNRLNATLRHCNIRGFYYGIYLDGGGGHLVEDNRLNNNLHTGIFIINGENNMVQRNRVYDTGGATGQSSSTGIDVVANALDNTVAGVFAAATDTNPVGIRVQGLGHEVRGNRVSGLTVAGSGGAVGIGVIGANSVDGNRVMTTDALGTPGNGIQASGGTTACMDNIVIGFLSSAYSGCTVTSGNISAP